MRYALILLCALTVAAFSGRAFAATETTEWHGYDLSAAPSAADEHQPKDSLDDQTRIVSIYAGRQSYAPTTAVQEQGDPRSLFDAVRVGVNLKFD